METTKVYYGCPEGIEVLHLVRTCVETLGRYGFHFSRPEQQERFEKVWSKMEDLSSERDSDLKPIFFHFSESIEFEFEAHSKIKDEVMRLRLFLLLADKFPVRKFTFSLSDHELDLNNMLIHEMVTKDQAECYERLYRMFKEIFTTTDSSLCIGTSNYSHAGLEDLDSTRGFLFRKDGPQELCGPLEDGLYEFCQLEMKEFYGKLYGVGESGRPAWLRLVDKPFSEINP